MYCKASASVQRASPWQSQPIQKISVYGKGHRKRSKHVMVGSVLQKGSPHQTGKVARREQDSHAICMLQGCTQSNLRPHQQVCIQVASGAAAKPAGQGCTLPAAGIGDTKCCTMLAGCGMLVKKQESRSTAVRKKRSRNLRETNHDQSRQCRCPLMLCTQCQCPLMLRTLMVTAAAART